MCPVLAREFFSAHALAPSKVAVAVSGGIDSTALLLMLAEWNDRPFELVAFHVDHRLRGTESDGDRIAVTRLCSELGLPLHVLDGSVEAGSVRSSGVEAAARAVRRERLLSAARAHAVDLIALAHNADDQSESVLLALLRGGGARRLAGMRPVDPPFIRPLLEMRRAEIEQYLAGRNVVARTDSTNSDTRFLRNRVRHEVLPLLELIQPAIRERLSETALQLQETESILASEESRLRKAHVRIDDDRTSFDSVLMSDHPHLFRRILLDEAFRLDPSARELTAADLRSVEARLHAGARRLTLTKLLEVLASPDIVTVCVRRESSSESLELPVDEGTDILWPPLGWRIRVERLEKDDGSRDAMCHTFSLPDGGGLVLRTRQAGDRFHPFGHSGPKKLKEWLINRKIERTMRDRLPLLVHDDAIVWIGGLALAAPFAVREESRRIYRVTAGRADADSLDRDADT